MPKSVGHSSNKLLIVMTAWGDHRGHEIVAVSSGWVAE
jgi:hypothetical protein